MKSKKKKVKKIPRSGVAVAAQHRNSAGPMRDRRARRSKDKRWDSVREQCNDSNS